MNVVMPDSSDVCESPTHTDTPLNEFLASMETMVKQEESQNHSNKSLLESEDDFQVVQKLDVDQVNNHHSSFSASINNDMWEPIPVDPTAVRRRAKRRSTSMPMVSTMSIDYPRSPPSNNEGVHPYQEPILSNNGVPLQAATHDSSWVLNPVVTPEQRRKPRRRGSMPVVSGIFANSIPSNTIQGQDYWMADAQVPSETEESTDGSHRGLFRQNAAPSINISAPSQMNQDTQPDRPCSGDHFSTTDWVLEPPSDGMPGHRRAKRRCSLNSMNVPKNDHEIQHRPTSTTMNSEHQGIPFQPPSDPAAQEFNRLSPTHSVKSSLGEEKSSEGAVGRRELPPDFEPSNDDVICGRGKQNRNHVGNRRFRAAIDMRLDAYSAAESKPQKSRVVKSIVDYIREASPKGGFVDKDAKTGEWFEIGDALAREKVGHALRFAIAARKRNANKQQPPTPPMPTEKAVVVVQRQEHQQEESDSKLLQWQREIFHTIKEDAYDEQFASFVVDTFQPTAIHQYSSI